MALRGVKVVELAGLAPAPFCGMMLADHGASVVRIDKVRGVDLDRLGKGKRSLAVDITQEAGVSVVRRLCSKADVFIDPYRINVMEKMGLGPKDLMARNKSLIYARLSGYGHYPNEGLPRQAGHDINFLAMSGVLSRLGPHNERPRPPINLLADFGGGGLMCAFGIMAALYRRAMDPEKLGTVVDCSMTEGVAYLSSWLFTSSGLGMIWGGPKGTNKLDGGFAFYDTYATKDGKHVAVGALEPQFFRDLVSALGLNHVVSLEDQFDADEQDKIREAFSKTFLTRTREEWDEYFESIGLDACVCPVLEMDEAARHPLAETRKSFLADDGDEEGNEVGVRPAPAPRLESYPAVPSDVSPKRGQHSVEVLEEIGFSKGEIEKLVDDGIVHDGSDVVGVPPSKL